MTPETLSSLAGLVLSLAFSYVPGLSTWYEKLDPTHKRLVMLASVLVAGLAAFGLSCADLGGSIGVALTCDQPGAMTAVRAAIACLIANQATYLITPEK